MERPTHRSTTISKSKTSLPAFGVLNESLGPLDKCGGNWRNDLQTRTKKARDHLRNFPGSDLEAMAPNPRLFPVQARNYGSDAAEGIGNFL